MKLPRRLAPLFVLPLIVGCHTTSPSPAVSPAPQPEPRPLPAWATDAGDNAPVPEDAVLLRIDSRFIELEFEADAADLPAEPYTRILEEAEGVAYLKALQQRKNVDMLSAPSVVTAHGQVATIEVGREMILGTEAHPETEFVGISNHLRGQVAEDRKTIDLDLFAQVRELLGESEAGPVISTRQLDTKVTLAPGQTLVLGGLVTRDPVAVENRVPVLGDIPWIGNAFRTQELRAVPRELIVVVTPTLVNREGARID